MTRPQRTSWHRRVELEALDHRHRLADLHFELGGLRRAATEDGDGHGPPAGEVEQDQSDRAVENQADPGSTIDPCVSASAITTPIMLYGCQPDRARYSVGRWSLGSQVARGG